MNELLRMFVVSNSGDLSESKKIGRRYAEKMEFDCLVLENR